MRRKLRACSGTVGLFIASLIASVAIAEPTSTLTRLTISSTSGSPGEVISLRASVSATQQPIPGGAVLFMDEGVVIAAVQVVGMTPAMGFTTGSATLKQPFAMGSHHLSAKFAGYGNYVSSTSDVLQLSINGESPVSLSISADGVGLPIVHFSLISAGSQSPRDPVTLQNVTTTERVGSVQLSNDAGRLVDRLTSVPFEGGLDAFSLGDFDGDGRMDVAVARAEKGVIEIFLADQHGSIGSLASFSIPIGGRPTTIASADLNGDGILDLVVEDTIAGSVAVYFGDPDLRGKFVALAPPLVLGQGLAGLVIADVNGDGILDVALTNTITGTVLILTGSTNDPGRFTDTQTLTVPGGPYAIAAGDLYGNGLPDLAVATYYSGEVWTLQNDPHHGGTYVVPERVEKVGNGPTSIVIADLTGDGIPDIAVCDSLDDDVEVLPGISGQRGAFLTERIIKTGSEPISIALVPNPSSRTFDLVVSNYADGTIEVLENDGSGEFAGNRIVSAGLSSAQVSVFDLAAANYPTLMALDSEADLLVFAQREWSTDGVFPVVSPAAAGKPLILQAVTSIDGELIASNQIDFTRTGTKTQTIAFASSPNGVYGQPIALTATASSNLAVRFRISVGSASIAGNELIPSGIGTVTVEASQPGNDVYAPADPVSVTLAIAPAMLRAVATPAQRTIGTTNPPFTGNVTGLVAGDPIHASFASLADINTPVGSYAVAPYAITPIIQDPDGRLINYVVTLTPAPLTILASSQTPTPLGGLPGTSGPTSVPVTTLTPILNGTPPANVGTTGSGTSGDPVSTSTVPVTLSGAPIAGGGNGGSSTGPLPAPAPTWPIHPPTPIGTPIPVTSGSSSPTNSPTSSSGDTPVVLPIHSPGSSGSSPGPVTTHNPIRFPISLGFSLPTLPIRALYIPIPVWRSVGQEGRRAKLSLVIRASSQEPTPGDALVTLQCIGPAGRSPSGYVALLEQDRELLRTVVSGYFDTRLVLHALSPGQHTVRVRYSGDAEFFPGYSNSVQVLVKSYSTAGDGTSSLSSPSEKDGASLLHASSSKVQPQAFRIQNETLSQLALRLELLQSSYPQIQPHTVTTGGGMYFSESDVPAAATSNYFGEPHETGRMSSEGPPAHVPRSRRGKPLKHGSHHSSRTLRRELVPRTAKVKSHYPAQSSHKKTKQQPPGHL